MRGRLMVIGLIAMLLASSGIARPSRSRRASREVQLFIREAMEGRLAAGDIPDQALLERSAAVLVLHEIPRGARLGRAVLPRLAHLKTRLVSIADLKKIAEQRGEPQHFLTIRDVVILGDGATISLSVDVLSPASRRGPWLPCSLGTACFTRVGDGRWRFVEWESSGSF